MRDLPPLKKYANNISVLSSQATGDMAVLGEGENAVFMADPALATGDTGEGENAIFLAHHHGLGGEVIVYGDPTGPNNIDRVKVRWWPWTKTS